MSDMPNLPAVPVEPVPTFDFSRVSWKEAKQALFIQKKMNDAQASADPQTMIDAFAGMQTYICKALIDVPPSWIVKDAPASIDWSQGESLDWLRGDKFQPMIAAYYAAQETGNASGGSAAH